MERGLFIKTQKGPGGPGPNEFMIQWAGIAEAQSSKVPSSRSVVKIGRLNSPTIYS